MALGVTLCLSQRLRYLDVGDQPHCVEWSLSVPVVLTQ